jgi:lysophospholipase L1-like esterase
MLPMLLTTPVLGVVREWNVLVFGDSQGDVGPTYRVLQDQFVAHNVSANVVNAAVGGTLSCGWLATGPDAVVKAAQHAFPGAAPDFVWFTAGGNDLAQDADYAACNARAASFADSRACLVTANQKLITCTDTLL